MVKIGGSTRGVGEIGEGRGGGRESVSTVLSTARTTQLPFDFKVRTLTLLRESSRRWATLKFCWAQPRRARRLSLAGRDSIVTRRLAFDSLSTSSTNLNVIDSDDTGEAFSFTLALFSLGYCISWRFFL